MTTCLPIGPDLSCRKHHLEERSDAHIIISSLAHHLLHALEQLCRARGGGRSLPTKPTELQRCMYRMLGLSDQPLRTHLYVVEPPGSDEHESAVLST